ncbi:MAG: hypothetical protein IPK19_22405 [Chloroflexi bacterium]|nr:hypothetical protein [Chloroflexota bacterium]
MAGNPTLASLKRLVDELTRPSNDVQGEENRQHAQTLATMTLSLLAATVVVAPIWIVTSPDFVTTPFISAGLLIALAFAYNRSRTRHYTQGAAVLVVTLFGIVLSSLLLAPGTVTERMLALPFLSLVATMAAYFLPSRVTIIVIGVNVGVILAFLWVPGALSPWSSQTWYSLSWSPRLAASAA